MRQQRREGVHQQALPDPGQVRARPKVISAELAAVAARDLAAPLVIIALGAALRFSTLGLQSYSLDEAVTVDLLRHSLSGMVAAIPDSEATPPLYYIIAWGWSRLFGTGEIALRALSALLGTAAIPVTYSAARLLISRRGALIAAAFVAVSPLLVWYSQEARAYVLLSFLGALSLLFFQRALQRGGRDVLWWSAVSILALTTHYFAVFFVAPEAAWLLIRLRERRNLLLCLGAISSVAVVLLPLAVYQEQGGRTSWIHNNPLRVRLSEVATEFIGISSLPHSALLGCAAGVLVLVGLLTWASAADRSGGLLALAIGSAAIALPLALATAAHVAGHNDDYFYFRNMIAAWIPLAIAAAAVMGTRRAGILGAGVACAVSALLVSSIVRTDLRSNLQRDDWRSAVRALGAAQPTRAIVMDSDFKPIFSLYRPSVVPMPTTGRRLDLIVLIVTGAKEALPGFRPPSGFERTGRRRVQHFTLVSFRSRTLPRVTPSQLLSPTSDNAIVMLDASGKGT
jgi:mannosyltransferase